MKIKYIHSSEPEREKMCDSVELNKRDTYFRRSFFTNPDDPLKPQDEYDKCLLEKMERDKEKGVLLSYQIV